MKKIEFESEEQVGDFFKIFFGHDDIGIYENDLLMDLEEISRRVKVKGYIKKSDLEKAKEQYENWGIEEVESEDRPCIYIKELEREIERLKKK